MKRTLSIKLALIVFIMTLYDPCAYASEWTPMNSGTTTNLYNIWGTSSSDVFAVGCYNDDCTIIHYDGSTWSPMLTPSKKVYINYIWGTSSSDVFAVGGDTILHYDGSSWSDILNPLSGSSNTDIRSVWGSSGDDVYFILNRYNTILHYDGSTWSFMTSGLDNTLYDVWGTSANNIFTVGGSHWYKSSFVYSVLHYDGNTWSPMLTPSTSNKSNYLRAIWGSSVRDIFALGFDYDAGSCIILHYDGNTWSPMTSGITNLVRCYDIWGSSSSDVFAVGDSGTILHYDGTGWSAMANPTTNSLQGVWGTSSSDVFAVGIDGTILHYGEKETTTSVVLTTTTVPSGTTTTSLPETSTTSISISTTTTSQTETTSIPSTTTTTVPANQCAAETIYGRDSEENEVLREYRDKVLSKSATGRQMIKAYYEASPAVAEVLQQNETARTSARRVLDALMPAIREKIKQ